MLGEGRVGKTSLLQRFISNTFDEQCASTTKATMFANTKIQVGDTTAEVSIWDTAGQERYHALGPIYYRDAHGAVLAYDITDKESFDRVKVWIKELHQVVGENIQVVVIGNKCDLERDRKVSKKDAEEWSASHNAQHFLCSAKLGIKVSDAFNSLVRRIIEEAPVENKSVVSNNSTVLPPQRPKGVKITVTEEQPPPEKPGCSC